MRSPASPNWIADLERGLAGDRLAFAARGEFGLRKVSYSQLWELARRAAEALARADVAPGSNIFLWAPNSPEWVACLLGILLQGGVVVPLDADFPREPLTRIASETGACFVFHGAEQDISFLGLPGLRVESLADQPPASSVLTARVTLAPADPAVIIYTSGTTSDPRGVILTHGNIQAQVERFRKWRVLLRFIPFRMLVIAPLSHVQGLMLGAFIPVTLGLSIVFVHSLHSSHLLRAIRDNHITLLSTVPRVLQTLTRAMQVRPSHRQGLTIGEWIETEQRGWMRRHVLFTRVNAIVGLRFWVILTGGAALARSDERFWRDTGRFVIQGYGLTETTAIVALNGPFSRYVGSIGKPLRNVSLLVADDGEILVRGTTLTPGYFGTDSPPASTDGYLHTGDLARVENGRLYFVGRKKDVIVTSEGFNVYPGDIEKILLRNANLADAIVIGQEVAGCEEVHAVLLLRNGGGSDAARIVGEANEKLAAFQRIRSWTVWPLADFPRSNLMKVRREQVIASLKNRIEASALPGRVALTLESIGLEKERGRRIQMLAEFLLSGQSPASASLTERLSDLGLSSLDVVALMAELERRSNRWLDHAVLPPDATLQDVQRLAQDSTTPRTKSCLPIGQPRWAEFPGAGVLRNIGRAVAVGSWTRLCASVSVRWEFDPRDWPDHWMIAAAPHRHWLDAFAICSALPSYLARKLLIVTNRDFCEVFRPGPETPWRERAIVGAAYYLGMPLTFPFVIVPHQGSTREGLFETARLMDRGYCPLVFPKGFAFEEEFPARHDPGPAILAAESGAAVIPVWITGNGGLGWKLTARRKQVGISFGAPIYSRTSRSSDDTMATLETSWIRLADSRKTEAP